MHYGRSLASISQEFFAGVGGVFGGGAGCWGVILSGLDTFLMAPNFLKFFSIS